ncbi:hypothetical protein EF906_25335, partial [Streptomyces sp. WAC08241]
PGTGPRPADGERRPQPPPPAPRCLGAPPFPGSPRRTLDPGDLACRTWTSLCRGVAGRGVLAGGGQRRGRSRERRCAVREPDRAGTGFWRTVPRSAGPRRARRPGRGRPGPAACSRRSCTASPGAHPTERTPLLIRDVGFGTRTGAPLRKPKFEASAHVCMVAPSTLCAEGEQRSCPQCPNRLPTSTLPDGRPNSPRWRGP